MRKFSIKIIIFLALLVSGAYALDYAISTGLRQMEDYRFQSWTDMVDSKINADLLIMGNSRALSHYSPGVMDSVLNMNCYNLGIGGHPFNVQYLKYKLYREHNKLPKVIVQNVDFFTFREDIIGHQREQVLPYVQDPLMRDELSNLGFSKIELYLPLFRYFGYQMVVKNGLFEFFKLHHYCFQKAEKGFWPDNGKWNPQALNNLQKIESFAEPASIRQFEQFIQYCKQHDIQLVMVYTPVYCKALEKLPNRSTFDTLFKKLSQKYQLNYLDYSHDPVCKDSSYFHVAIHLNKRGAEWFSRKLSEDLKPILKSQSKGVK